jgi:hypothetical protein
MEGKTPQPDVGSLAKTIKRHRDGLAAAVAALVMEIPSPNVTNGNQRRAALQSLRSLRQRIEAMEQALASPSKLIT